MNWQIGIDMYTLLCIKQVTNENLCGHGKADRNHSTFKVRRGGCEEIPLIQGKEQWLRFAGVAVKRYPMSKVRETQVRG